MLACNDNAMPTPTQMLESKWVLMENLLSVKSINALHSLIDSIAGKALTRPYNGMIPKFSKSSPLIAITRDGAIIQHHVPYGEKYKKGSLYNIVAYTKEGRYTIFDIIGKGWDDGEWLETRRLAAQPLTLKLTLLAADLIDDQYVVCEVPRDMPPEHLSCIVFGYIRGQELRR